MSISSSSSSCSSIEHCSNLENFLHSITPIINHASSVPLLQDIWEIYDEWSACGVGVPIMLKNGEQVVQYYVPYLSAIQIFMKKTTANSFAEEGIDESSTNDDDDSSTKTKEEMTSKILGDRDKLYIQFYETCSPYLRMPFLDKINELAQSYDGLYTFSINDISPASWMSIAWYPIYHIPALVHVYKDLCTCFLTFHALSPSFQENNLESVNDDENIEQELGLVPFGLATYKMQGDVWSNSLSDDEKIKDLHDSASSMLKDSHIHHPDYIFFTQ